MADLTDNKNYLQPTGFRVLINRKNYPNLSYFIQGVTHPGADVNPTELPIRRVTSVPLAGDKITYGTLSLEIIVDENLESYKEMQGWLEHTVNVGHTSQRDSINNNTPATYGDIVLSILSSHNNQTSQIKYHDCIPTSIGAINMTSTAGDVQYITFTADFRFSTFELI